LVSEGQSIAERARRRSVGNLGASREAIIAALDYLFVGV